MTALLGYRARPDEEKFRARVSFASSAWSVSLFIHSHLDLNIKVNNGLLVLVLLNQLVDAGGESALLQPPLIAAKESHTN